MKQEFTQILNEFIYANPEKQEEIVKSMEAKAAETRAARRLTAPADPMTTVVVLADLTNPL